MASEKMKNTFKKIHTRDTYLIIQQSWFEAFKGSVGIIKNLTLFIDSVFLAIV